MIARAASRCLPSVTCTSKFNRHAPTAFHSLRMASSLPRLAVFEAIASHEPQSSAVIHCTSGRHFTYGGLLKDVANAKDKLCQAAGDQSMDGQRVAFLVENGYDYVGANRIAIVTNYLLTNQ